MGILIIDGNNVYEVDEECLKMHKRPKECILPEEIWDEKNKSNSCIQIKKKDKKKY